MGTVKTYPRTPDVKLSANFMLHEFACKDNGVSKTVLVDDELIQRLEQLRAKVGKPININSGYRTQNHDKAVGGSGRGMHTRGMAADIWVEGLTCVQLGMAAKEIGFRGIGMYHRKPSEQVVHVDTRPSPCKWLCRRGATYNYLNTFMPTIGPTSKGETNKTATIMLQSCLHITEDGIYGKGTVNAVKNFQKAHGLTADGICGPITWKAIAKI
jgi:peptidoglycan hydrolase-like protein with peptidoglycan-binding domain